MSTVTKRYACLLPDARGDFPHCHLGAPRRPWVLRIQKHLFELNAEDESEYNASFMDMQKIAGRKNVLVPKAALFITIFRPTHKQFMLELGGALQLVINWIFYFALLGSLCWHFDTSTFLHNVMLNNSHADQGKFSKALMEGDEW